MYTDHPVTLISSLEPDPDSAPRAQLKARTSDALKKLFELQPQYAVLMVNTSNPIRNPALDAHADALDVDTATETKTSIDLIQVREMALKEMIAK